MGTKLAPAAELGPRSEVIEPLLLGCLLALVSIGCAVVDSLEPRPAELAEDNRPDVDEMRQLGLPEP